jgi:hypothetical protein
MNAEDASVGLEIGPLKDMGLGTVLLEGCKRGVVASRRE